MTSYAVKITKKWDTGRNYRYCPNKGTVWFCSALNVCEWKTVSFSAVFQSYEGDGRLIMKGCVQWSFVYG